MAGLVYYAAVVQRVIFEIIVGCLTTKFSKELWIGNPTQPEGPFFDSHDLAREKNLAREKQLTREEKLAVGWRRHHISAFDVQREAPILMDPTFITKARLDWGEDSPMWYVHVLGEFPPEGPSTLFPLGIMERCRLRTHDLLGNPLTGMERDQQGKLLTRVVFGIDVGGGGQAETVVAVR